jgi:hypothetical protein
VPYQYTLAAALVLASVYVFGHRLRAASHHRRWVSIAAGVSVSTVFLDLLPEISEGQRKFSTGPYGSVAFFPEQAVYLSAMLGFVLFYGLEYMVATSPSKDDEPNGIYSALRIAAFAAYSGLIAYLLIHSVWKDASTLLLYTLAMAFHFLLVDHSLFSDRYGSSEGRWRWILALAVLAGWSIGTVTSIPEHWLLRIIGFVCGGVIMNTIVVELPEGRGGRFWLFAFAAAAYSSVLIVVLG